MEESILLGAPLKMEGQNQPTRVGEIVNTFADIANIVNPREGMTVFVRDEQASYRVLSLKAKTISGVSVANAQVDKVEKCVDNKRITGTSPDSNALTDPFKFIGSFSADNVQDLWNYLDGLCGTEPNEGNEGFFRARFGNNAIEVYSTPLHYTSNHWLQVLKGRYSVKEDGSLKQSDSYNILQRTHKANTGWSEWEIVAGGDLLTTMATKINDVEKKVTDLIGEAPATLDTIHEIAAWILNDEDGAAALVQQIATLNGQVSALSSGLKITTTLSPTVVYRGESSTVKVNTTLSDNTGNVEAAKMNAEILGNMQEVTGAKSKVFTFNNVVLSDDNTIVKTSANYNGMTLSAKNTLYARYPIYMGVGTNAQQVYDNLTNKQAAKTSAAGKYNATIESNGQFFYLLVPTDVTQPSSFYMNSPFAMAETTNATFGGIAYKVYRSANSYNAGTKLNIEVK